MIRSHGVWRKGASVFLTGAVFTLAFLATEGWAQMTQVNLGITFRNARVAPLWVAEKEGYFKKHGIDIKIVNISGGTLGAQTLLSGGIDLLMSSPPDVVTAVAGGGAIVEVMPITTVMPYYLVGAPGVKSIADLKGKRVGSSGLGLSASRLALLVAFGRLGLNPERDQIVLVAAGQEPERIVGVASGAIGGTVLGPEYRSRIEQLGLNVLADLRAANIPWENDDLITTKKFLASQRDVVERAIKALLEANAYTLNPANRSKMVELLMANLGLKTPQDAMGAYEDLVKYYVLKKPHPNREGIQTIIAEIAKVVPNAAALKFEDVVDPSIIEKLDKSGFIDGLYK